MERQMKKQAFTAFDAADYLENEADIAAYLAAASEDDDPQVLVVAMGDVIRARNVSKIARDAGLTREGVYKAFSADGNPSFATVMKVAKALDLEFSFRSRARKAKSTSVRSRVTASRTAHKSLQKR
jgi:probable addiction module antidote protein